MVSIRVLPFNLKTKKGEANKKESHCRFDGEKNDCNYTMVLVHQILKTVQTKSPDTLSVSGLCIFLSEKLQL